MVRRLEDIKPTSLRVIRRHNDRDAALAELFLSEISLQSEFKTIRAILRRNPVPDSGQRRGGKYAGRFFDIELKNFFGRIPQPKRKGDNPASARPSDEIKIFGYAPALALFPSSQKADAKKAFQSSAVQAEDLKSPVHIVGFS